MKNLEIASLKKGYDIPSSGESGELLKTAVFIDYENLYYSCRNVLKTQIDEEDIMMLMGELQSVGRCEPANIRVYADFSGDGNLRGEMVKVYSLGAIINTFGKTAKGENDTDFRMLEGVFDVFVSDATIKQFIFLTGDGHFAGIAGKLKSQSPQYGKVVGVYAVEGTLSEMLVGAASWAKVIKPRQGAEQLQTVQSGNSRYTTENSESVKDVLASHIRELDSAAKFTGKWTGASSLHNIANYAHQKTNTMYLVCRQMLEDMVDGGEYEKAYAPLTTGGEAQVVRLKDRSALVARNPHTTETGDLETKLLERLADLDEKAESEGEKGHRPTFMYVVATVSREMGLAPIVCKDALNKLKSGGLIESYKTQAPDGEPLMAVRLTQMAVAMVEEERAAAENPAANPIVEKRAALPAPTESEGIESGETDIDSEGDDVTVKVKAWVRGYVESENDLAEQSLAMGKMREWPKFMTVVDRAKFAIGYSFGLSQSDCRDVVSSMVRDGELISYVRSLPNGREFTALKLGSGVKIAAEGESVAETVIEAVVEPVTGPITESITETVAETPDETPTETPETAIEEAAEQPAAQIPDNQAEQPASDDGDMSPEEFKKMMKMWKMFKSMGE